MNLILLATIAQSPRMGRERDFLRIRHRLQESLYACPHLGPTAPWFLPPPLSAFIEAFHSDEHLCPGEAELLREPEEHLLMRMRNRSGLTAAFLVTVDRDIEALSG